MFSLRHSRSISTNNNNSIIKNLSSSTVTPFVTVCFILLILGIVGGVVILSLISLFLPNRAIDPVDNQIYNSTLFIEFSTDIIGASSLEIVNLDEITEQFRTATGLGNKIKRVVSAQFIANSDSINTRNKRLASHIQKEQNSGDTGEKLVIGFLPNYDDYCHVAVSCQRSLFQDIQKEVATKAASVNIKLAFSNGESEEARVTYVGAISHPSVVSTKQTTISTSTLISTTSTTCVFRQQVSYRLDDAANPRSVSTGDIDNDGKIDIVVTNNAADNVTVLLNSGDGTFLTEPTPLTGGGSTPYSVTLADINKDDKLDAIVANYESDTIGILMNSGYGELTAQKMYQMDIGSSPSSVVTGDINGDGAIDILVTNSGAENFAVFINMGNGIFVREVTYSTGSNSKPYSIALLDVNGNNKIDVAVANSASNSIGIFMNRGDGTFSRQKIYSTGTGSSPKALLTGDINGDGRVDIIVANYNSNNIGCFINRGGGLFSSQSTYSTNYASSPISLELADINSDNKLDIIVANSNTHNIGILLNRGDGTFSSQITYSTGSGSYPNSVKVADVNNDNKLDIVVANFGSDSVGVMLAC